MKSEDKRIDTWVKKAQQGDKASLESLYDYFLEPIYRYIFFRSKSAEEAEDLTEEVFFRVLTKLHTYKKQKYLPFSAWIFRIAKNMLIDNYRKNVIMEEIPEDVVDESEQGDTRTLTEKRIEKKRLVEALKKLPKTQSDAISLKYFSQLENSEIAIILEKSETAVRILQSRGLKKLKSFLQGDEA